MMVTTSKDFEDAESLPWVCFELRDFQLDIRPTTKSDRRRIVTELSLHAVFRDCELYISEKD